MIFYLLKNTLEKPIYSFKKNIQLAANQESRSYYIYYLLSFNILNICFLFYDKKHFKINLYIFIYIILTMHVQKRIILGRCACSIGGVKGMDNPYA